LLSSVAVKKKIPPIWVSELSKIGGDTKENGTSKNTVLHDEKKSISSELGHLAKAYFAQHGINEKQYGITELQLLNAEKNSEHQIWHRDNAGGPGLTALIALNDITYNGPTEILLGTHLLLQTKDEKQLIRHVKENAADIKSRLLLATLQSGDAIVYDARVLHRGRGYTNVVQNRPVLIIRWDAHDTPPPGTGFIGTQMSILSGKVLSTIESLKEEIRKRRT